MNDFCNSYWLDLPFAMLNRLQGVQNAADRLLNWYEEIYFITHILRAALATN